VTVDLRSDTLTVPDAGMRAAMAAAEVGDDVWGEDPTVTLLEERVAALLGKAAAVYVPSGTMGNLTSVAAQTRPGDEVILDSESHIVQYEVGGAAAVAGVQLHMLDTGTGLPSAASVRASVREANIHHPVTRLLCIENTHNRRGGAAFTAEQIDAAAIAARDSGLRVHCDGARLLNAATATATSAARLVEHCNTVSVCFSKGLGAPVGSVVVGDADVITEVRRWRKRLGGGMRQAGVIAAAAVYALDHNVERLADDHANAAVIAYRLRDCDGCAVLRPDIPTNIVVLQTREEAAAIASRAAAEGVLVTRMGPNTLRCVTHLNVDGAQCARAADVLARAIASA
jgi:threonine aldolase